MQLLTAREHCVRNREVAQSFFLIRSFAIAESRQVVELDCTRFGARGGQSLVNVVARGESVLKQGVMSLFAVRWIDLTTHGDPIDVAGEGRASFRLARGASVQAASNFDDFSLALSCIPGSVIASRVDVQSRRGPFPFPSHLLCSSSPICPLLVWLHSAALLGCRGEGGPNPGAGSCNRACLRGSTKALLSALRNAPRSGGCPASIRNRGACAG